MGGACKAIGAALAVLGIAVALTFGVVIMRDDAYRRAEVAASHNPGNVMYETELAGAKIRRGFELVGVITGVLLSLNGTTLLGLGVVAGRVRRSSESASR
jgi:hypothetical protein